MKPHTYTAIFEQLAQATPHPRTELCYTTAFELLVAVILSAQATDKSVNLATTKLFPIANTPQTLVDLGQTALETHIKNIGLYRAKARYILATSARLLREHNGEVPNTREALQALPGVGRKTASVLLNTLFGVPAIAVDTHLFRLGNRIGLARGKTVRAVEAQYLAHVPAEFMQHAHHWLILHGRYVCTARAPKCASCVINTFCEYQNKTTAPTLCI